MTSKKNLHISTEIDHRSNLSSQSTPAKCKMPRTGQFLPRRRARTGRNMEASSYCLGMPNGLLPLGLRWLILDPKRIPNVWFVESRLLFRNVGKHSHHRYIIDIYIYISIYLPTINIRVLGVITQLILSLPRHVGPPWAPWHRAASSTRC